MMRIVFAAALVGALAGSAHAQIDPADDAACRLIGAEPGTSNYSECRVLMLQSRTNDPYWSLWSQAGLRRLQQRIFQERRRPPLPPAGGPPPSGFDCLSDTDQLGGTITRCQ
jgi:hypothetical protein